MIQPVDFAFIEMTLAVLCVSQILEVWRHGSIFEETRAKLEAGYYVTPDGFLYRLLSCMFCLSVWVTGAVVLLLSIRPLLPLWLQWPVNFLMVSAGLTRAANIVHDLARPWSRTPGARSED